MSERDDDEQKPAVDPDRAAILARRQRFIALALTGLSTTACTTGDNKSTSPKSGDTKGEVAPPNACLKVAPREGEEGENEPVPQPCLSVPIQPEPPQPQVCLKMVAPPPETESGEAESGEADTGETKPQPCLKKAAPKPCLKQAAPKPCLNMVEPS